MIDLVISMSVMESFTTKNTVTSSQMTFHMVQDVSMEHIPNRDQAEEELEDELVHSI
jgi:ABC-type lipoprotein release transport system permease subunit